MSAPSKNNRDSRQKKPPLIYIVDDEPMVLELAELILNSQDYQIEKFRSPALALEQFEAAAIKPDLIVTDYAMNEMHGLALMDACRRICPGQKVLLMSGTVEQDVFQGRSVKPDAFIAKPFDVVEFADAVRKLSS